MIDSLYLESHDALPATRLFHLGRINVVCGKNSSGKSTLLRALVTGAAPGVEISGSVRDVLITIVAQQIQDSANPNFRKEIVAAVDRTLATHDRWFPIDADEFVDRLTQEKQSHGVYLPRLAWDQQAISQGVVRFLAGKTPFTLIPAKRRVEVEAPINTNVNVSPDGSGLTNKLSFLHNQLHGSAEKALFENISAAFAEISDGFSFALVQGANNKALLHFSRDKTWREADSFGLGLQDLLLLVYFAHTPEIAGLAIEEPETHMHPDMQRRLLAHFAMTKEQYFLATHSNVFLSGVHTDRVLLTRFVDGHVTLSDVTSRAEALSEMGFAVSDNISPDLILLVEGPNDVAAFTEFLGKWELSDRFAIRLWPLGGDSMKRVDLDTLKGQEVLAIIDRDPDSKEVREDFKSLCAEAGVDVVELQRYALENYFPLDAYQVVFPDQQSLRELAELKPNTKVQNQVGFDPKRKDNIRKLAKHTSKEYLAKTDIADVMARIQQRVISRSLNRHALAKA